MNVGIYRILNLINNKFYIGSSSNLNKRYETHKDLLRANKHYNKHLQSAFIEYGADNFEFAVIEYCDISILMDREQYWIDFTNCNDKNIGYNKRLKASSNLGVKWDQPRIFTSEHKSNISKACLGRKLTKSQSEAVSKANKNRVGRKYNKPILLTGNPLN